MEIKKEKELLALFKNLEGEYLKLIEKEKQMIKEITNVKNVKNNKEKNELYNKRLKAREGAYKIEKRLNKLRRKLSKNLEIKFN